MASLRQSQTPETTEDTTNRIDLAGLSNALTRAGWTDAHLHGDTLVIYRFVPDGDRMRDVSRITVYNSPNGCSVTAADWLCGMRTTIADLDTETMWPPCISEPHWQHALDIIGQHTAHTPARSRTAGTPGEGGTT